MKKENELEVFSKLAEAANFYLNESFHYINESMISEFAGFLFAKQLDEIDHSDADREIASKVDLPSSSIELLQSEIPDVLTQDTIASMSSAWDEAQVLSRIKTHNFELSHRINSIEILGHLNNFAFFIETLINRHLLFMKYADLIDNIEYSHISKAKVRERLIFIFKKALTLNEVNLDDIISLFRLRNKTVHYTPKNAIALKPMISELTSIWQQAFVLINQFENAEKFNEDRISIILNNKVEVFKNKWTL